MKSSATKTWASLNARGTLFAIAALILAGCSGSTVEEGNYVGDMQTSSAVVQPTANGGYRTISGDPDIAVNDDIEQESMMPYGGGQEGIREVEDEEATQSFAGQE